MRIQDSAGDLVLRHAHPERRRLALQQPDLAPAQFLDPAVVPATAPRTDERRAIRSAVRDPGAGLAQTNQTLRQELAFLRSYLNGRGMPQPGQGRFQPNKTPDAH